jgi:hypothetical protein
MSDGRMRRFPFDRGPVSIAGMLRRSGRWWAGSVFGVGMFLCTNQLHAQPKPVDPKLEQAKVHMAAGTSFYNEPPQGHLCEEASVEFGKAYELSGSWKALRALAICEQYLERDGAAIPHYEEVLKRATEMAPEDRKQIGDDLTRLKSALATLTVTSNVPAARLIATRQASDGTTKTNRYPITASTSLGLHPGAYSFTAQADGFPDVVWTAEVGNGSKVERAIEFKTAAASETPTEPQGPKPPVEPKPVELERPVPITVWIFTGVTGAAAIGTGVFMGLAASAKSDFDAQNGVGTESELTSLRDDVITKNIVADVLLGTTIAAAGATLVFYFTRPEVAVSGEQAAAHWTVAPSPVFGPVDGQLVGATASVIGSFQ